MRPKHVLALLLMVAACRGGRTAGDPSNPAPIEPPPSASGAREKPAPSPREIASLEGGRVGEVTSLVVRDKNVFWVEHVGVGYEPEGSKSLRGSLKFSAAKPEPRPAMAAPPEGKRIATFAGRAELAVDAKAAFLAIH